jgi:N-acetylneuraminic acid mutarotase
VHIPRRTRILSLFAVGSLLNLGCSEDATAPSSDNKAIAPAAAASVAFPSGTWTAMALMPELAWRAELAAGAVNTAAGQMVYVLGGRFKQSPTDLPASTILAYDVARNAWATKAARFTGANTNGVGTIGGKLYISGGSEFINGEWKPASSKLFAYDPAADRLIRKADMPTPSFGGVTGVINGKLYVLTGRPCSFDPPLCGSFFYRYDPVSNAWTSLPPGHNYGPNAAGVVLDGKFYVAGGNHPPSAYRSFSVYDPATNEWQLLGRMPPRRRFAVGAAAAGKVYVIGIEGTDPFLGADRNTVAYHPGTNTWRNKGPYPGPQGEDGQFLLRPSAAVRVLLGGSPHILALGSGHFAADGTITRAPPYMYAP